MSQMGGSFKGLGRSFSASAKNIFNVFGGPFSSPVFLSRKDSKKSVGSDPGTESTDGDPVPAVETNDSTAEFYQPAADVNSRLDSWAPAWKPDQLLSTSAPIRLSHSRARDLDLDFPPTRIPLPTPIHRKHNKLSLTYHSQPAEEFAPSVQAAAGELRYAMCAAERAYNGLLLTRVTCDARN
eukprot:589126-Rhodomonas_salina.2